MVMMVAAEDAVAGGEVGSVGILGLPNWVERHVPCLADKPW